MTENQDRNENQGCVVFGPHAEQYVMLTRLCQIFDDVESLIMANENRLRSLLAIGFDETSEAKLLRHVVESLKVHKHQIDLELRRTLRKHPLGPWMKKQIGIGERQGARLLGAVDDPYWNAAANRPRRGPAELWAYCGLHTLPVDHNYADTHTEHVNGNSTRGHGDQVPRNAQQTVVSVAARRQRGQKANWNTDAKSRAYLVAESCMKQRKSPYRIVYDQRKEATVGRLHQHPCLRCGPKGRPAPIGSPWSDGHRNADALRIVSKEILKHLWRESKRLHQLSADQIVNDTHVGNVSGNQLPIDHEARSIQSSLVDEDKLSADQLESDIHTSTVSGNQLPVNQSHIDIQRAHVDGNQLPTDQTAFDIQPHRVGRNQPLTDHEATDAQTRHVSENQPPQVA